MTEQATLQSLRAALLGILAFGCIGTLTELYLLEHTEDRPQLIPILLLSFGLVAISARFALPGRRVIRGLQLLMFGYVISGFTGVYLHFRGNMEFELEMYPSLSGLELAIKALSGATPTLAPGTMALLGLVGLAYTFRHPLLHDSGTR